MKIAQFQFLALVIAVFCISLAFANVLPQYPTFTPAPKCQIALDGEF